MPDLRHPCGTRLVFNPRQDGLVSITAYDPGSTPEVLAEVLPGQAAVAWWARLDEGFEPIQN